MGKTRKRNIVWVVSKHFKCQISFDLGCFSSWQLRNEGIPPCWAAQTSWTQLPGENEGKGQQNLQGQELRWLPTRQSSQPRKSKQVLNELECFYAHRSHRGHRTPNPACGHPLVEEVPTSSPWDSASGNFSAKKLPFYSTFNRFFSEHGVSRQEKKSSLLKHKRSQDL